MPPKKGAAAAAVPTGPEAIIDIGLTKEQRDAIQSEFVRFAHSDCHHDFKSTKVSDLLENVPLNTSLSSFKRASNIANIREGGDKNVYEKLKDYLESILGAKPRAVGQPYDDETELLHSITGLNMDRYKTDLKSKDGFNLTAADKITKANFDAVTAKTKSITVRVGAASSNVRKYKMSAFPYKLNVEGSGDEDEGNYKPPALVFQNVAGGGTKFAMIVDASFLPLSKLKMATGTEDDYHFIFLESIENESDSATKIGKFEAGSDKILISSAKDEGNSSIFPSFDSNEQNANLFTGVGFQTERSAVGVNGTFKVGAKEVFLSDLGEMSNITNASQLAINKLVEYFETLTEDEKKDICIHLLTKRAGDWCQALCLLDKSRLYTIEGKTMTLAELEQEGYKIGVMTHDRILLAFCLLIGVNCFFTMKLSPGNAALVFFENELTLAGRPEDVEAANKKKEALEAKIGDLTKLQSAIDAEKAALQQTIRDLKIEAGNLKGYLEALFLSSLQYNSYLETTSIIDEINAISDDTITVDKVRSFLSKYESLENKINLLINKNKGVKSLELPASVVESITNLLDTVKGGKTLKQNVAFINFTETYIYALKDLLTTVPSEVPTKESISDGIPKPGRGRVANLEDNAKYILVFLRELIAPAMSGGVRKLNTPEDYIMQLNEQFFKLRHRSIIMVKTEKELSGTTTVEGSTFIAKYKGYITDRLGNYYSVIDDYIITIDDCELFITNNNPCEYLLSNFPSYGGYNLFENRKTARKNLEDNPDSYFEFMYMYLRFLLLHHDILYTQLKKVRDEYSTITGVEESDFNNDERVKLLFNNINILIDYTNDIFLDSSSTTRYTVKKLTAPIKYTLLDRALYSIREYIYQLYKKRRPFEVNGKQVGFSVKLQDYLKNEAAQILASLSADKQAQYRSDLEKSEEELRNEAIAALKQLYKEEGPIETDLENYLGHEDEAPERGGGGGGGLRKTRTNKKRRVRKTKRSKNKRTSQ